jgi:hypothetical protein
MINSSVKFSLINIPTRLNLSGANFKSHTVVMNEPVNLTTWSRVIQILKVDLWAYGLPLY